MCDTVVAAPPTSFLSTTTTTHVPVAPVQAVAAAPCAAAVVAPTAAPIAGCQPAPNRAPQIFKEVTKVPGAPGKVTEVVKRLPTPTADVIDKTIIEYPGQDTVNVIYERPTTPPPNVVERRLVQAPPAAQVNCFERRVPHRACGASICACNEPTLAAMPVAEPIAFAEPIVPAVAVSTAAPAPCAIPMPAHVQYAPSDATFLSSYLAPASCGQRCAASRLTAAAPCAAPIAAHNFVTRHYPTAPCAQMTPLSPIGQYAPCTSCVRRSKNLCRRHVATPFAAAAAPAQHFQSHLAVQPCAAAVPSYDRYFTQYANAPAFYSNAAPVVSGDRFLGSSGASVPAPVNYATMQFAHGPYGAVVRRDL